MAVLAAERYGTETLRQALPTAAGDGLEVATIAGVDLRGTRAALAAEVRLRDNSLVFRWDTRNGDAAGAALDLVIEWRASKLAPSD